MRIRAGVRRPYDRNVARIAAFSEHVAEADDAVGELALKRRKRMFKRRMIAVEIGEDAEFHRFSIADRGSLLVSIRALCVSRSQFGEQLFGNVDALLYLLTINRGRVNLHCPDFSQVSQRHSILLVEQTRSLHVVQIEWHSWIQALPLECHNE